MAEFYQNASYYILSLFSGIAAEVIGIILLIAAGWIVVKRRFFIFAMLLTILSLSIAVGSTVFSYFKG